jgi:hypothetical protein
LASYRPISNLSFISKLIERIVARRFSSYVFSHNLLPSRQSGFRPFHSTETAVLSVHNDLVRSIDDGQVAALLLDLSSAFDTVDHSLLLTILANRFSVSDTALDWFRSYLTDRSQSFLYNGHRTDAMPVDSSVPQGSVLGPLEFVAYTEDVVGVTDPLPVTLHQYADDMQLYMNSKPAHVSNVCSTLVNCVNRIKTWCSSRRLLLNANKTELIWFGSRANLNRIASQSLSLSIGTEIVTSVDTVRDLGVLLDSQLSMKPHIAKVTATCFFHLRRLRQIRRRCGQEVTTRLVLAFVTSRIDYCNSVLAGLPQSTLTPLQRVQNSAVRLIFNLLPHDHVTPGLIQLHWLPIQFRITYKLCLLMFLIRNNLSPQYLSDMIQPVRMVRCGLRSAEGNANLYERPLLHSKFGERSFSYAGPAAWFSLPAAIRVEPDLTRFKSRLKTHLFILAFNFDSGVN